METALGKTTMAPRPVSRSMWLRRPARRRRSGCRGGPGRLSVPREGPVRNRRQARPIGCARDGEASPPHPRCAGRQALGQAQVLAVVDGTSTSVGPAWSSARINVDRGLQRIPAGRRPSRTTARRPRSPVRELHAERAAELRALLPVDQPIPLSRQTTTVMFAPIRRAVSSSCEFIRNPPSPQRPPPAGRGGRAWPRWHPAARFPSPRSRWR